MITNQISPFPAIALALILALGLPGIARSGGVDNRSNNSADYVRSLARNAATNGADISVYNPAGTVRMPAGLHVSLSNQVLDKYNEQSLETPERSFKQSLLSPLYPTGFAVYRRKSWAAYGAFSFAGGGGELEYEKGSATVYLLQSSLNALNPPRNADTYLRSIYPAATFGGAYAFKDFVSVSLGLRYLYARTDVRVDGGRTFAPLGSSKLVDHMEEARGFTGILGLDAFPMRDVTLALRFEGPTPLEFEVQRSELNLDEVVPDATTRGRFVAGLRQNLRSQGARFQRDLPANLGLGASYAGLPGLRAELAFNHYFQSLADWEGKENLHDDSWELALGLEYQTPIPLMLSAGGMYTVSGAGPATYQLENPALDSYTLGAGGRYAFPNRLSLSVGFAANLAFGDEVTLAFPATSAELDKSIFIYALGIEYGLF